MTNTPTRLPATPHPHPRDCNLDELDEHSRELKVAYGGDFQVERWSLKCAIEESYGGSDFLMHLVNDPDKNIRVMGWGLQLGWVDPYQARVLWPRIAAVGGWYACWGKVFYWSKISAYTVKAELPQNKP